MLNDTAEFEMLLAPILDKAFGTALHLTRNRDTAEDLVQETALQAYRAFDSFRKGTNFKAWFFHILVNQFRQDYRKRRREPEIAPLDDAPDLYLYVQATRHGLIDEGADPAKRVFQQLDQEQIQKALAALPNEFRMVCVLYFMEELSYTEIADITSTPIGTVRSRLHRGRKLLQKALWQLVGAPTLTHIV